MVDTLVGSIVKRMAHGRNDGVAVLAEGLVEILPEKDLAELAEVERDAHDHIRIAEINFGDIIKKAVQKRLAELGIKLTTVAKNIGYEVRCADPIPFDMEYTRDLGYCAARFIIEGGTSSLISIQDGRFKPIAFKDIMDPATGRMRVRMVDVQSDYYKIARSYMLRLREEDFDDPVELGKLAAAAGKSPEDFRAMFAHVAASQSHSLLLKAAPKSNFPGTST
jgi:6-phosphofructokinase 1